MNDQKLKEANDLKDQIEGLKSHKNQHALSADINSIQIDPVGSNGRATLRNNLLPIPAETFRTLYMMNVDTEIARLEKKFAELKSE